MIKKFVPFYNQLKALKALVEAKIITIKRTPTRTKSLEEILKSIKDLDGVEARNKDEV